MSHNTPQTPQATDVRSPQMTPSSARRVKNRWSSDECTALIEGCVAHGVGAWKKILESSPGKFSGRTSVDLKDKFRTLFPAEYKRLYASKRSLPKRFEGESYAHHTRRFERIKRRHKRNFTRQEDESLLRGYAKYGCAWARIAKDPELGLTHRKGTDLRDRFRNAFPEKYIAHGYKLTKLSGLGSGIAEIQHRMAVTSSSSSSSSSSASNSSPTVSASPITPTPYRPRIDIMELEDNDELIYTTPISYASTSRDAQSASASTISARFSREMSNNATSQETPVRSRSTTNRRPRRI